MPNRENIQKWVDALRSGEYQQTTGTLRGTDPGTGKLGYCCLGVACDISGVGRWNADSPSRYEVSWDDGDVSSSVLPRSVAEWLGLDQEDPIILPGSCTHENSETCGTSASVANDNDGLSFDEIADAVEALYLREDEPAQV